MLNRTAANDCRLAENALPVPKPPIPGTSPAQARPSHTGHTRQYPFIRCLATFLIASISKFLSKVASPVKK
jgi:hypothetical protein